ncbi:hypothetical protein [Nostoc sp. PA-18-2419]|uniref:hypothetical protein n=1 Tax=Nostoc sp. PA-18-2419 TaxID=2575443 RepID=UPI0011088508|nr:hypothetical protein [Nostoc sp. PA-18-2419]
MKQNYSKSHKTLTLLALGLLMSSCGRDIPSLENVNQAVENLDVAAKDISTDMYGSCIRATKFFGTPGSPTILSERQPEEKFCNENYQQISLVMGDANQILIDYMNALVLVAKGESEKGKPISFDESYKNLGDSLTNLKFSSSRTAAPQAVFKPEEVQAGVAIAKFLTNLFTKEMRRNKLKQAILCTDSDIQAYIKGKGAVAGQPEPGGLIAIANKVYVNGLLAEEEISIRTYFSEYIALFGDDLKKNPLDFIALEEKYNNAMDLVRDRKQKAQMYSAILRNLASLHASLKQELAKDDDIPLTGEKFDNYCQELFQPSQTKTVDKGHQEIKPETMQKVQAIIAKHMKVIKPLLKKIE